MEWASKDGLKDAFSDAPNAVFDRVPELCNGPDCIDPYKWEKSNSPYLRSTIDVGRLGPLDAQPMSALI